MKCENCNNELNYKYGSGRFCSQQCARSFSTKEKRVEINQKVSKKLKKEKDLIRYICEYCKFEFFSVSKNRKFCGVKCLCAYMELVPRKNTSKMGGLRDGGGRSKVYEYINWLDEKMKLNVEEMEVAKILDNLKLNWKRNWNGFKYINLQNKERKFYPDFYLKDYNCYIEYKGWVTEEMNHKMRSALENNDLKLIIIYSNNKRFNKLGLNLKQITENPKVLINEIIRKIN